MPSRMERYYQTETNDNKETSRRTVLNQDLYENMYDEIEYSNVEGIASIDKTNEIDINRIKEMLKNRSEEREFDNVRQMVKRPTFKELEEENEYKNYDIHELLNRAKTERPEMDQSNYRLDQRHMENFKEQKSRVRSEYPIKETEHLQETIDTITNTSKINAVKDKDLSLDVLSDLKSNTEIVTTDNESIRKIINAQRENEVVEKEQTVDKSFYTSGMAFEKEDFDKNEDSFEKEGTGFIFKALIFIMLVIITSGIIIALLMYFK